MRRAITASWRDAARGELVTGAVAGAAAWAGMAVVALVGVSLLGLGTGSTPAALALAVGGAVDVELGAFGVRVDGVVDLMPLGISLLGAVLLAAPLRTRRQAAGAAATFGAGLLVVAALPAGQLDVRFWATLLGGVLWLGVVLGIRVLTWVEPTVRTVVTGLLAATGAAMAVGTVAAAVGGIRVLGTILLGGPNLLFVALTRGLGAPWTTETTRLPLARVDAGHLQPLDAPLWPLTVLAVLVVAIAAARSRTVWVAVGTVGVAFGGMAWLAGVEVAVHAQARGRTVIDATVAVTGSGWLAAGVAAAVGLFVAGARNWHRRRT
jgi:hypothetical protein